MASNTYRKDMLGILRPMFLPPQDFTFPDHFRRYSKIKHGTDQIKKIFEFTGITDNVALLAKQQC